MSKATPGPWHIGDKIHGDYYVWGPDPKAYGYIAQVNACGSKTNPQAERDANAHLIAAAPALLAACKAALNRLRIVDRVATEANGRKFDPSYCMGNHDVMRDCEAAISLAEPTEGGTD